MLLAVACVCVVVALGLLIARPTVGVPFLFLIRPVVDTTWADPVLNDLNLSMLLGVLVPVIVVARAVMTGGRDRGIGQMPLVLPWLLFSGYVLVFCGIIAFVEGWLTGIDVFFRHINGIVGFYMVQAWFRDERSTRRLMLIIALAGVFPMTIGLYQIFTGVQWTDAQVEGLTRYVGLYHDAFTVRFYMMQTLLASLVYVAMHPRIGAVRFAAMAGYCSAALVVVFKAYSKSAMSALFVWALMWLILRRRYALLAVGAACAVVLGTYFSVQVTEQIGQLFNKELSVLAGHGDVRLTFQGRWFAWAGMIDEWKQFSAFAQVFGSGHRAMGSHNDYVQLLIHGGIVGLVLYVALLAAIGTRLGRNVLARRSPLNVAAAMAFSMWLIDSIGLVPSVYPPYQWFVWGLIGLAARIDANPPREAFEHVVRAPLFQFVPTHSAGSPRGALR